MPRIRTIKPEFWHDEKLSNLPAVDRLVFLGLIGMADDFGRVHHNIKVIDAFIFPNTDDSVRESLANLSRIGRVRFGNASNGMPILEIVNWEKHQRVDKPQQHLALPPIERPEAEKDEKPNEITVPEQFANDSGMVRESFAPLPGIRDQGSGIKDQRSNTQARSEKLKTLPKQVSEAWAKWRQHQAELFVPMTATSEDAILMELHRSIPDPDEQVKAIEFSIARRAKHLILNGDHKQDRAPPLLDNGGRRGSGSRKKTTFEDFGL